MEFTRDAAARLGVRVFILRQQEGKVKFLSRNKLYSAIEFVGLSVALAFVIISFCYVVQQYAVTRVNPVTALKKE